VILARKLGYSKCTPRSASSLGWFHGYDGNIIGGAMLGSGMALTGACPGTVLVQVATGIKSGYFVLAGAMLGGMVYTNVKHVLRRPTPTLAVNSHAKAMTVFDRYGIREGYVVLAYEAICVTIVLLASRLSSRPQKVILHPIIGGLLISGGQGASLALTGNTVGVSTVYEQAPQLLSWTWMSRSGKKAIKDAMPEFASTVFAFGIITGSWIVSRSIDISLVKEASISMQRALLGGFLITFGARTAQGCTSGHGISGMSTLSISSIVTVASIFSGGVALASSLK
jgi:uncharacterized membrane protein YedE/YeeE